MEENIYTIHNINKDTFLYECSWTKGLYEIIKAENRLDKFNYIQIETEFEHKEGLIPKWDNKKKKWEYVEDINLKRDGLNSKIKNSKIELENKDYIVTKCAEVIIKAFLNDKFSDDPLVQDVISKLPYDKKALLDIIDNRDLERLEINSMQKEIE